MTDDLSKPLGLELDLPKSSRFAVSWRKLALISGLGGLVSLAMFLAYARDPAGGEPVGAASIQPYAPPPEMTASATEPKSSQAARSGEAERTRSTATELEQESGVKVVRPGGRGVPSAVVLRVPDEPQTVRLAAAPDKRLVEKGKHGLLPRIGDDGLRPSEVYARPHASRAGRPRIAIVVTGLGIGQTATANAIEKLPGAVTLAFAPYGGDLERGAARARADGHEILLQMPMEPFDYPDNDPGPHTLVSGLAPEQNLDRMQWLMSRFHGYVGITNHMGAKFTSEPGALAPVLKEIGKRGLLYLEDSVAGRSMAGELAAAAGVQALRGDVQLDASAKPADADAALARLEALARTKGYAIGVSAALPGMVERIAKWAAGLEARGFELVPVSAIAATQKRTG